MSLDNMRIPAWLTCSGLAVILHGVSFTLPGVNLEFSFVDGSQYFGTGSRRFLDLYFHYEANTLGIPFLIHALSYVGLTPEHVARLISLAGIPLMAYAVTQINKALKNPLNDYLLLALVLLNPLVFVFSGRGTADFFPAALALFGATYPLNRKTTSSYLLGGSAMGVAGVLKYHALLLSSFALFLVLLCEAGIPARERWKHLFAFYSPAILPLVCYLQYMHRTFGFWLYPPTFQGMIGMRMSPHHLVSTLITYIGYLILLMLPFSIYPDRRKIDFRSIVMSIGIYSVCFLAGYWLLSNSGEMDLGPVSVFLNQRVLNGVFVVLCFRLTIEMSRRVRESSQVEPAAINRIFVSMSLTVILALLCLSFTRPAQRYLLFCLPMGILLLPVTKFKNVRLNGVWLLAILVLDSYLLLNQYIKGTAAQEMASYITSHSLSQITDFGVIEFDVGNPDLFNEHKPVDSYVVVQGAMSPYIHKVTVGYPPFLGKTYSMVEIGQLRPMSRGVPVE